MPKAEEAARGGAVRIRTLTIGRGKNKRYVHVAVVRKKSKRGGKTVAGPPRRYQGAK